MASPPPPDKPQPDRADPPSRRPAARNLTADGRLKTGKLAGLSMNGAIWVLSWPILVESLLNSLVGFVDTRLASGLGMAETDAIGAASYIQWFFGLTIMALGIGATAMIARAVGKGRLAVANAAVGQMLVLQVIAGSFVAFGAIMMAPVVASLMSLEGQGREAFIAYLRITSLGIPITGVLFGGIACVRGAGDSKGPLLVMMLVNAINVVLSFVLSGVDISRTTFDEAGVPVTTTIIRNPFTFELGITGIALGTIGAQLVGAAAIIWLLRRGVGGVRLRTRRLKLHMHTSRRLVRLGLPNFLETLGMWSGNFLVVLMVGAVGSGALGAHIIAIRAEAFSFLPGFAMGMAAASLAGQFLGAGSPELARKAVWRCAMVAVVLMGLIGVVFITLPRLVVSIFSEQPEHLITAPPLLVICGVVQVPFALAIVFRQAMRGAGDVRMALLLTTITTYLVRLPACFLLSGVDLTFTIQTAPGEVQRFTIIDSPFFDEPSLTRLWIAMCGELVIRAMLFSWRYFQGGWTRQKV